MCRAKLPQHLGGHANTASYWVKDLAISHLAGLVQLQNIFSDQPAHPIFDPKPSSANLSIRVATAQYLGSKLG